MSLPKDLLLERCGEVMLVYNANTHAIYIKILAILAD
jgi:hypothetical protein